MVAICVPKKYPLLKQEVVHLLTGKGRPGVFSDTDQMSLILYQILYRSFEQLV